MSLSSSPAIVVVVVVVMSGGGGGGVGRRVVFDRVLGKGTFSTVYRALVEPDDRHIALKIVHLRDIIGDPKTVRDCINEINHLKVSANHDIVIIT